MPDLEHVNTPKPLLEVHGLKKYFSVKKGVFSKISGWIKAVDGIDFTIVGKETFGLVGESGCGKSTTAKMILLIEPPTEGVLRFKGSSIIGLSTPDKRKYWKSVQAVLQDPSASLSPRLRVGAIIGEPLKVKSHTNKAVINERIREVLRAVGLRAEHADLFPHEFSGGQRQRIAIARALSTSPKLIILDEPISSLDVSIRAQVMNLLLELQGKMGLSYLLIAHDLAVVLHMCTKIGVMYVGKMVERVDSMEIYNHPIHPYTKALFAGAFHQLDDYEAGDVMLPGEVPSPLNPPKGCRFHPRCPHAMTVCRDVEPSLIEVAGGHYVACHLIEKYGG